MKAWTSIACLSFFLWSSASVAQGDDVGVGLEAARKGDYETALSIIRPAAEEGDPIAQNAMGVFYGNGFGVELDYTEAARWYGLSSEQGYASAHYNLGLFYANGRGVERDLGEAYWHFKAAYELGSNVENLEVLLSELRGILRERHIDLYLQLCIDEPGNELELISSLGGGEAELQSYCQCSAKRLTDAIELFTFQVGTVADFQRLAFKDECLSKLFPNEFSTLSRVDLAKYYPEDADSVKSYYDFTTRPEPLLSFQHDGSDPATQVVVIDASSDLFCWTETFEAGAELFKTSPDIHVAVPMECESGETGYGGVYKFGEREYVVGFALINGQMDWTVHSMDLR